LPAKLRQEKSGTEGSGAKKKPMKDNPNRAYQKRREWGDYRIPSVLPYVIRN